MEVLIVLGLYFLPSIIAACRNHLNTGAIIVLNLLLGWTVIGWIVALIWSVSNSPAAPIVQRDSYPAASAPQTVAAAQTVLPPSRTSFIASGVLLAFAAIVGGGFYYAARQMGVPANVPVVTSEPPRSAIPGASSTLDVDPIAAAVSNLSEATKTSKAPETSGGYAFTGGAWSKSVTTSPIDDSEVVVLSLSASSEVKVGYRSATPTLFARCKSKKTEIYINFDAYLGLDSTEVVARIDSDKAVRREWDISTDNKAAFHPVPVAFLKRLATSKQLVIEVIPYGENPITVTFATTGLIDYLPSVAKACGWKA